MQSYQDVDADYRRPPLFRPTRPPGPKLDFVTRAGSRQYFSPAALFKMFFPLAVMQVTMA
jgi:hypothetical protein